MGYDWMMGLNPAPPDFPDLSPWGEWDPYRDGAFVLHQPFTTPEGVEAYVIDVAQAVVPPGVTRDQVVWAMLHTSSSTRVSDALANEASEYLRGEGTEG